MSPEKQRIAIATACGWKCAGHPDQLAATGDFQFAYQFVINPNGEIVTHYSIPDYLTDLNAMHEAEKVLTGGMRSKYDAELTLICSRDYNFIWESTAPQRAEAFLRTLGLWEEEQDRVESDRWYAMFSTPFPTEEEQ